MAVDASGAITIYRGDTHEEAIKVLNAGDLTAMPLSGCTVQLTAKPPAVTDDPGDAQAKIKLYLVVDSGGTVTSSNGMALGGTDPETGSVVSGAASGVITITIDHTASKALPVGSYVYDLEVETAEGYVQTFYRRMPFDVDPDVTEGDAP